MITGSVMHKEKGNMSQDARKVWKGELSNEQSCACQQGPVVHTAVNPSCQAGTPSGNFLQAVSLLSFWLLSLNTYADLIKNCQQGAKKNIPTVQLGDGFVFSFYP